MNRSWSLFPIPLRLFLFLALLVSASATAQPVQTDYVEAELVPDVTAVEPGEPFTVALRMDVEPGWHVYWKNPGDAGMATTINWTLPAGFEASDILWPYPYRAAEGPLVTYAYKDNVLLLNELTPPDGLQPGDTVHLAADADWLVCKEICLPGNASLTLDLPVGTPDPHPTWSALIAETRTRLPRDLPNWEAAAAPHGEGYLLRLTPTGDAPEPASESLTFFAGEESVIEHAAPQLVSKDGASYVFSLEPSAYATERAERLHGVVVALEGWDPAGEVQALAVDVPVDEALPVATTADLGGPGRAASQPISVWAALGFAFLGGLILNLMPCVFPVLSIKALSFVQMANEDKALVRRHGWIFAAGVVMSFLALAGLLLVLRAGGEQLGWGFQLQSPGFVALMAFLLFVLALSLAGLFEIGTSLMRVAGQAGHGSGYTSSFASGVLATVVATPCTAPFMGSALGFALTQPAVTSLAIFAALGLGMAAPYVLLSMMPRLMQHLPKPGPWMETFKQAMAFPLFATVIWLVWVFGQQVGLDGATYLLLGLLLVGMAGWLIGRWPAIRLGLTGRLVTRGLALLAVAGALLLTVAATRQSAPTAGLNASAGGIDWQPYSAEQVEALQAEGRPVFVDFTASWCLSCKVNERVALSNEDVMARFRDLNVAMLKADWTSRDPAITEALASFGRSGIPLYVLYTGDPNTPPTLLPEILSPGIVLEALDDLADRLAQRSR